MENEHKDRVEGKGKEFAGKVQQGVGHLTGDARDVKEGQATENEGKAQNAFGKAKDAVGDAVDNVKDAIEDTFGKDRNPTR
jgi:uncharacterized protein YjbJ (UPF0337 family)